MVEVTLTWGLLLGCGPSVMRIRTYEATAMNARLLEKIEETTHYVIKLQQEVNQLRQQN